MKVPTEVSSSLSNYPISLIVLIVLAAVSAAVIGWLAQRAGQRALGFWILSWGSLLGSAAVIVLLPIRPELLPVSFLFSSLTSPLMAMGAYAYSKRKEPSWLIPLAGFAGMLRLTLFQLGTGDATRIVPAFFEPPFAFLAAYLVVTRKKEPDYQPGSAERFLALSFACFGLVELGDVLGRQMGVLTGVFWSIWLVVSLPLFTQQIALQLSRLARHEMEHETQVQATLARLNTALQSDNDLLLEIDSLGTITFASEPEKTGPKSFPNALAGKKILDLAQSDANFGMMSTLKKNGRITSEDVDEYNREARPPVPVSIQGERKFFESKLTSYETPRGELRIVGGILEVTTRVRQEEIIRKNTMRLNRAESIAHVGSWEVDAEAGVILGSNQFTELYGLPQTEEPISHEVLRGCIHPEDCEYAHATWFEAIQSVGRFEQRFRIHRASDGALRYLRIMGEVEQLETGRLPRAIGATMDITEQRALEEKLRRGQERFERFAASNIVGVFFMDSDGTIRDANEAFLEIVGYAAQDLPLHWRYLTPESDHAEETSALQEILTGATTRPYEKNFLHKSGRHAAALVAGAGLGSDQAIVLAVDLRERKIKEELIELNQHELEETVALRTNELLESRVRLEESERLAAVGTLAAGVAHQINNPIGAILNSAEYALLCREDEDATQIFERVLNDHLAEANRCAQIVRSMLQFSRDQPAERWIEDLRTIARRAHRSILPYAEDCHARVNLILPPNAVFAQISPIEIEQAVINTLRNSIESNSNGATISLSLAHADKMARIEVIDDGRGIPPEELDHLFEPFYSNRTKVGGTGLGLSVAHGIVTAHAGEIHVRSIVGSGTRVVMTLPTIDADPEIS